MLLQGVFVFGALHFLLCDFDKDTDLYTVGLLWSKHPHRWRRSVNAIIWVFVVKMCVCVTLVFSWIKKERDA